MTFRHCESPGRPERRGGASCIALRLVAVVAVTGVLALVPAKHVTAQERAVDGDPVDLFTGLHTREHDDIVLDGTPEIRLTRSYRNRDSASRAFGIGTSHSYDLYLVGDAVAFTYADLILKDGGRIRYVRTSPGSGYTGAEFLHTATPSPFFMSRLRWNGHGWDIDLRDGGRYSFLPCGGARSRYVHCGLIEYRGGRGGRLTMARDAFGNLTMITSGWFRTVRLTYDSAHRVVRARTGIGPAMTTVAYEYDDAGRLGKATWSHVSVHTVLLEIIRSYVARQLPSFGRMWIERTMQYTYDDQHQMVTVKEPGLELEHEYDSAGRVIRQQVAGWGVWTFRYTEAQGKVVQTDVVNPDGRHRRVVFNADGYSLSDTVSPGKADEDATLYERVPNTNAVTRITVKCRSSTGVTVSATAPVADGETEASVRDRVRSQCAR